VCGIAGIIGPDGNDPTWIESMTLALVHRGPDGRRTVHLDGCHLGHTRLSVIDIAGGAQPMADPSERYWIVFNGEIFNHRELRERLTQAGWAFKTRSDTEVLLAAYVHFGDKVVEQLNGQFAFAVWDTRDRRLFAARDRFGEKPLYYAPLDDRGMIFASELRAILATVAVEPRLDLVSIDAYLGLLYVPPDRCIYENIHTLPPAHALVWQDGSLRIFRYWQPALSTRPAADRDVATTVRSLLDAAVERQMVADVPVGAFLSGGLDSATVVALMSRHSDRPIQTFSLGFGAVIDELPYARQVAEACHTDHHEIQAAIPVAEMIEHMAEVYDEPLGDSSNVPTHCVAQAARQHVTVALSGDGGDEVFGGYDWYAPWIGRTTDRAGLAEIMAHRLTLSAAMAMQRLGLMNSGDVGRRGTAFAARQLSRRFGDIWTRHIHLVSRWHEDRSRLWGLREQSQAASRIISQYEPPAKLAGLDRLTWFDLTTYLPGDILVKVDRATMAHGLESRTPFLDTELTDYVLSLPASIRFVPGRLKALLRDACGDLWPAAIRNRKKQGFGAPVVQWMQHPAVGNLWRRVTADDSPLATLLPGIRDREARSRFDPQQRWTLLQLGLWLEKRTACLRSLS
jgi:asparagine synthase (glutamine-hydrolysing)